MNNSDSTRIAIPMANGQFCEHFGGSEEFLVFVADRRTGVFSNEILFTAPEHTPGALPRWLEELDVDVLVASAIGKRALIMLASAGIEVFLANGTREPSQMASAVLAGSLLPVTGENSRCNGHHDHEGHDCNHP